MPSVRTNDGHVFVVDQAFIEDCSTLYMATTMLDCSDGWASLDPVPIPLSLETFKKLYSFFLLSKSPGADVLEAAEHLGYKKLLNHYSK